MEVFRDNELQRMRAIKLQGITAGDMPVCTLQITPTEEANRIVIDKIRQEASIADTGHRCDVWVLHFVCVLNDRCQLQ